LLWEKNRLPRSYEDRHPGDRMRKPKTDGAELLMRQAEFPGQGQRVGRAVLGIAKNGAADVGAVYPKLCVRPVTGVSCRWLQRSNFWGMLNCVSARCPSERTSRKRLSPPFLAMGNVHWPSGAAGVPYTSAS